MNYLVKLPNILPVLSNDDKEEYGKEVRKLMIDQSLPSWTDDKDQGDIVSWWKLISVKYQCTFKVVISALSIFCTPRVEGSFSIMSDIIDKKSSRMKVETLNVTQTIKYALYAAHPKECTSRAVKHFRRIDKNYSPVDPLLASNMRLARSRQRVDQAEERSSMDEKNNKFQWKSKHLKTKKKFANLSAKEAE